MKDHIPLEAAHHWEGRLLSCWLPVIHHNGNNEEDNDDTFSGEAIVVLHTAPNPFLLSKICL